MSDIQHQCRKCNRYTKESEIDFDKVDDSLFNSCVYCYPEIKKQPIDPKIIETFKKFKEPSSEARVFPEDISKGKVYFNGQWFDMEEFFANAEIIITPDEPRKDDTG